MTWVGSRVARSVHISEIDLEWFWLGRREGGVITSRVAMDMLEANRAGMTKAGECGKLRERMECLVDLNAGDARRYKGRRDEGIGLLPARKKDDVPSVDLVE